MLREIQAKGKAARFEKVDRGLFKKNLVDVSGCHHHPRSIMHPSRGKGTLYATTGASRGQFPVGHADEEISEWSIPIRG
jgi:hypothetical protein